jgi:hypothetical protein
MDKWKKPGLYSSITQFILFTAASIEKNNFRVDRFIDTVKKAPEHPESEFSFFRDPGLAEQSFIISSRFEKKEQCVSFTRSCSRLLPISIPLLLVENKSSLLKIQ